jgi:hypothetical protein
MRLPPTSELFRIILWIPITIVVRGGGCRSLRSVHDTMNDDGDILQEKEDIP